MAAKKHLGHVHKKQLFVDFDKAQNLLIQIQLWAVAEWVRAPTYEHDVS